MKRRNHWRSSKTHPLRRGWYRVTLGDGSTDWRAWGRGHWWKQIPGGWITWFSGDGKPHDFKWRGPRKDIALDYHDLSQDPRFAGK
jgi:hypothetical protein